MKRCGLVANNFWELNFFSVTSHLTHQKNHDVILVSQAEVLSLDIVKGNLLDNISKIVPPPRSLCFLLYKG